MNENGVSTKKEIMSFLLLPYFFTHPVNFYNAKSTDLILKLFIDAEPIKTTFANKR